MANKYANQIYEAIDILTDQKLRNLKLDCTVQAIVKDNTNASKGYYTIEIQDANQNQQIIARSNRIDYVYPLNSCVYVTIPQNNSALDKWILGSVEVETSELDAYYFEEERPVKSGANGIFDGALALAQLIGGGDMLIIDFKVKDSEASGDGDGKLSFKGALKVGNTELVPVELNEDNIEGDPYFVDDTQRFTYKIPAREYEITDIISFQVTSAIDIEIDKIYIGKSDNKPFTKLLTAKLLNTADPPQSQEKIVFNFAADAIQRLQLQAYYNGVAIENNVTYSWVFDDTTMNHVISGSVTNKQAIFSRNELWRDGTFNFTAAITYDGERVPITSSVSSINFPIVSISQSTAGETTTLTANLMVGSDIKENPWGGRTKLTYLWNDGSTTPFITRPKLKSGDSQNYTCTVKQQGIEIGSGNSVVIPQPEAAAQGVIAITNGNALLVWDESNTFKNDEIVLSATIYDVNGKEVCSTADDGTEKPVIGDNGWLDSITWTVHANDLYKVKDNTRTDKPTLTIVAKGDFNLDAEVPQIEVTLTIDKNKFHQYYPNSQLKDYTNLYAITEFTATQQGMPGTNGSKYIVKPLVDYLKSYAPEAQPEVIRVNFRTNNIVYQSDIQLYTGDIEYQVTSNYSRLSHIDTIIINSTFEADQPSEDSHVEFDNTKSLNTWYTLFENVSASYEFSLSDITSLTVKDNNNQDFTVSPAKNFAMNSYGSYVPEIKVWNNSYSIQEYGFLAAAAPYIRVKPRVWDVELKQWLPEEGLSYSTQLMYSSDKIQKTETHSLNYGDEYSLISSIIGYGTANIIRLTAMLDGKKFTSYLPLVIGGSGTESTKEKFANCLDHPFFYVMYDSTSTVPFYRYKGKNYNWAKVGIDLLVASNSKYLLKEGNKLKVNDDIFANDGINEKLFIHGSNFNFYVPILFANVTSLYDFVGDWDGESAKIGEDYVISPIAAFGGKDENNKFTGLVLGQSKGADSWNQTFTLHHLRFTNSLETYGAWLIGEDSGTIVPFTPKKTHIIPVTTAYNADQNQEIDLTRFGNPYIVLSAGVEYGTSGDTNKPTRWFKLYGIDWDALLNTEIYARGEIQNAEIYWGNHIYTYTITETNDVLGMVAYHNNERTFELDANTGKLSVGKTGKGQIVINPTEDNAVIYGGDYKSQATYSEDSTKGSGMMINLTEPGIYWGNGNFSVDKNGALKSTSGEIGGFTIVDDALYSIVDSNCAVGMSTAPGEKWAFWAGTKTDNPNFNQYTGANAQFRVGHDGTLIADNANLKGSLAAANISTNSGLFTVDSNGILTTQKAYILNEGQIGGFNLNNNILKSGNFIIDPINQLITFGNTSLKQSNVSYTTENPLAIYFTGAAESNKISYKTVQTKTGQKPAIYFYNNYLSPRFYYRFISNADGTGYYNNSSHKNRNNINLYFYYQKYGDLSDSWIQFNSLSFSSNTVYTGYRSYSNDDYFTYIFQTSPSAIKIKIEASRTIYIDNQYQSSYRVVAYESDWISLGTTITMTSGAAHAEADYQTVTAGTEIACTGPFLPDRDSAISLGNQSFRWSQVWEATGTIQTSDRNVKNSIETIPSQYLDFYDKLNPVRYKFNQNTSNRYHIGLIAQDVEKALQESNISTQDFAGFISYAQEDGTGYGLRYDEFIALCIAKTQQQDKEISDLKSEIQELKTLISQLRGQEG